MQSNLALPGATDVDPHRLLKRVRKVYIESKAALIYVRRTTPTEYNHPCPTIKTRWAVRLTPGHKPGAAQTWVLWSGVVSSS